MAMLTLVKQKSWKKGRINSVNNAIEGKPITFNVQIEDQSSSYRNVCLDVRIFYRFAECLLTWSVLI